jgi:hypothetical protein
MALMLPVIIAGITTVGAGLVLKRGLSKRKEAREAWDEVAAKRQESASQKRQEQKEEVLARSPEYAGFVESRSFRFDEAELQFDNGSKKLAYWDGLNEIVVYNYTDIIDYEILEKKTKVEAYELDRNSRDYKLRPVEREKTTFKVKIVMNNIKKAMLLLDCHADQDYALELVSTLKVATLS